MSELAACSRDSSSKTLSNARLQVGCCGVLTAPVRHLRRSFQVLRVLGARCLTPGDHKVSFGYQRTPAGIPTKHQHTKAFASSPTKSRILGGKELTRHARHGSEVYRDAEEFPVNCVQRVCHWSRFSLCSLSFRRLNGADGYLSAGAINANKWLDN